ncbi:hypothetical protein swp_1571 [Shewanella piezotolerans WP3]|uniref:Uncharacterized protein n=1 Tax=Shewanella piezotolerans (strain WP3 / JCM 13877) TaxID=225849 RepID=B8CL28_SHEPW|nr:hypothetical protein swp_1571 [Shewanella piezotolerans WP3]
MTQPESNKLQKVSAAILMFSFFVFIDYFTNYFIPQDCDQTKCLQKAGKNWVMLIDSHL